MSHHSHWRKPFARFLSTQTKRPLGRRNPRQPERRPNVERLEDRLAPAAVVHTDQDDYAPGSTAIITATSDGGADHNFQMGETVQFHVTRTDGVEDFPPGNEPWRVTDGVGDFTPYRDSDGMWWYPDADGAA